MNRAMRLVLAIPVLTLAEIKEKVVGIEFDLLAEDRQTFEM